MCQNKWQGICSLKFIFSRCPVSLMPPCLLLNLLAICPALPAPGLYPWSSPFASSRGTVFGVLLVHSSTWSQTSSSPGLPLSSSPRVVLPTDSRMPLLGYLIDWEFIMSTSDLIILLFKSISDLMNSVSVLGVVLESSEFCKTELENHRDRLLCEQDNSIIETLDWEH